VVRTLADQGRGSRGLVIREHRAEQLDSAGRSTAQHVGQVAAVRAGRSEGKRTADEWCRAHR